MKDNLRQLRDAKPSILDADGLFFRGKGLVSRMIRSYGRGRYSHVAKASWIKGELFCVEVRELKGGRIVTLESQVKKFPGQIDVFRTNVLRLPEIEQPEGQHWYNRKKADEMMLAFAGVEYGYWAIFSTYLLHAPFIKFIAKPNIDDEFVSKRPPYCSAAYSAADRIGGRVDQVPQLADKDTEPNDLARSPFNGYICTLIPDRPPEENAAALEIEKAKVAADAPPSEVIAVTDLASPLPEKKDD